jgi:hypothetical protein
MRHLTPEAAIYAIWFAWALSWLLAAVWSSRAARRLNFGAEAAHRVVTVVGFLLLFFAGRRASMMSRLVRIHPVPWRRRRSGRCGRFCPPPPGEWSG